jgi:hypothetical protein
MAQEITIQTKEEPITFLKKTHELQAMLKALDKGSKDAVELLVRTMNDEKQDLKIRLDCAKTVISSNASVAAQVSADSMSRLIAEIKVKPGGASKTLTLEDGKPKTPLLDFSTIREI